MGSSNVYNNLGGGGIFLIVQSDKDRKLVLHCNLSVKLFSANQGNWWFSKTIYDLIQEQF